MPVGELRRRADEDRDIRDRWHAENRAAIATLTQKLDHHADAVEMLRPAVAAFEVSRSRLVALASLGFAGVVVFGWIVEALEMGGRENLGAFWLRKVSHDMIERS